MNIVKENLIYQYNPDIKNEYGKNAYFLYN